MIVYAVAAVIFFAITFLSTKERVKPIKEEKSSVKTDLKDLIKNDAWIILFAVTILFILFTCVRTSVTTHYFKYFVGVQDFSIFGTTHHFTYEDLASAFNGIGQAFSLIGVFLVPWFAGMSGKKRAVSILLIVAMICTGAFYFFQPSNLILIFVFQIFGSVTGGPISAILWSMYADTADYSEWKTGNRATGLIYSASIMSNKIGWAVGAAIVGLLLGLFGFKANEVQNADVQDGLRSMMSLIPVAFGFVALVLLYFYKLDEKKLSQIKADLDTRRAERGIKIEE